MRFGRMSERCGSNAPPRGARASASISLLLLRLPESSPTGGRGALASVAFGAAVCGSSQMPCLPESAPAGGSASCPLASLAFSAVASGSSSRLRVLLLEIAAAAPAGGVGASCLLASLAFNTAAPCSSRLRFLLLVGGAAAPVGGDPPAGCGSTGELGSAAGATSAARQRQSRGNSERARGRVTREGKNISRNYLARQARAKELAPSLRTARLQAEY